MSKIKTVVMAALALATVGTAVHADTFTLTPSIDTSTYYSPVTDDPIAYTPNPGQPVIVLVNFTFTLTNLGAGEGGLGSALFNITLPAGTAAAPALVNGPDWTHDSYADDATPQYKASSKASATSVYATDADEGPSSNDLQAITFYLANPPYSGQSTTGGADPRLTLGQNGAAYIGQADILWDGVTPAVIGTNSVQFSTWDTGGTTFGIAQNAVESGTVTLGGGVTPPVPEPASLGLLALGGLAILKRRRKA